MIRLLCLADLRPYGIAEFAKSGFHPVKELFIQSSEARPQMSFFRLSPLPILGQSQGRLFGFLALMSSGLFAAFGFMLLASNRWAILEPAVTVFIILCVQWQTLGLTIAKLGVDNVVYAMVSKDETLSFMAGEYVLTRVLPLTMIFSVSVWFVFSPLAAISIFFTILLDSHSIMRMADLNARRRYALTAIGNLLNYPMFFFVTFVIAAFVDVTSATIAAIFVLASLARWLWLQSVDVDRQRLKKVSCRVSLGMGVQQALNYLLFRIDQIVLGTTFASLATFAKSPDYLSKYLFMAKFPELVAGVMVIVGTVVFREVRIQRPVHWPGGHAQLDGHSLVVWGAPVLILLGSVPYVMLWEGDPIESLFVIPFLVHAICIFPANLVTYSMIRQGCLSGLLRNLVASVMIGIILVVVIAPLTHGPGLAWVVGIQLGAFIVLSYLLPWGDPRKLYA